MAQSSHPPMDPACLQPPPNPVAVVNEKYCARHPVDLVIARESFNEGGFAIKDINGNVVFKLKRKFLSIHDRRTLLDASDSPIITFQQKALTTHRRWNVFRGESLEKEDMLFTVRKSSILQSNTKLHVFLASNESEDVCDFRLEYKGFECDIHAEDSKTIIAQMHKKDSNLLGVKVCPNVDYAFIAALVVILEEINYKREQIGSEAFAEVGAQVGAVVGAEAAAQVVAMP